MTSWDLHYSKTWKANIKLQKEINPFLCLLTFDLAALTLWWAPLNWSAGRISHGTDVKDTSLPRDSNIYLSPHYHHSLTTQSLIQLSEQLSHILLSSVTEQSMHLHLLVSLVLWIIHLYQLAGEEKWGGPSYKSTCQTDIRIMKSVHQKLKL